MRIEIEADLVIALKEDLLAEAGSQLIIIEGEIVGVIPPRRSLRLNSPQGTIAIAGSGDPIVPARVGGAIHEPAVSQGPIAPEPDTDFSDFPATSGGVITREDVLGALKKRPFTARKLTLAFAARGKAGSVKSIIKSLRLAGVIKPLSDSRFPKYGLAGEAAEKAYAATAEAEESHPARTITQQMILDVLEDPKALSMTSIAKALHIAPKTAEWSRLSGTTGSMVKFGTLKKIESNGMMLLGLPEHHQAA